MSPLFYVYRHIRPDLDQVFYVGRGKLPKSTWGFGRAYTTRSRSPAWREVVEKNQGKFIVEIIFTSLDEKIIDRKEVEFIALYGKMENGGILVNRDDGGRAPSGFKHTEESRRKMREAHKRNPMRVALLRSEEFKKIRLEKIRRLPQRRGYTLSAEHCAALRAAHYRTVHPQSKMVIDLSTGFIFDSIAEARDAIGLKGAVHKKLSGKRHNNTTLRYL